jgi:hypothetical protein
VSNYTKDPMISFRNTIRGLDSKGAERFQLYLNVEEAQKIVDVLTTLISEGKQSKIDLHVAKRTTNDGRREFDSAYAFIKHVEPKSATMTAGGTTPTTASVKGRFVPASTAAAVEKMKKGTAA